MKIRNKKLLKLFEDNKTLDEIYDVCMEEPTAQYMAFLPKDLKAQYKGIVQSKGTTMRDDIIRHMVSVVDENK